jgi:hypothetical protein
LLPTVGAAVAALLALVVLFVAGRLLVQTVDLANRGVVVRADVVAARHGTRADFVTVRLTAPVGRTVDLMAWTGTPRPGDTMSVRYDPAYPAIAEQEGQWPWFTLSLELGAVGFFVFACWWDAPRPWRRERRRATS